jgi:hypothetical protein
MFGFYANANITTYTFYQLPHLLHKKAYGIITLLYRIVPSSIYT